MHCKVNLHFTDEKTEFLGSQTNDLEVLAGILDAHPGFLIRNLFVAIVLDHGRQRNLWS